MPEIQSIHIAIEIWGVLFCLVATVIAVLTRHFDRTGSVRISLVLICSAALLACDAISWIARGRRSLVWYILLRVNYFGSLFFGFLLMPLSAEYVAHVIYKRSEGDRIYWSRVEWVFFFAGLLMVSEFMNQYSWAEAYIYELENY